MCGIAGIVEPARESVDSPPLSKKIDSMVCRLVHRGPDDQQTAFFRSGPFDIAVGATRLAILDLSTLGRQPMIDEVTGCALVYNGELYNFAALRDDLRREGTHVTSTGDTEVLLRAYIQWGPSFVSRLRGMFAFAIFDPRVSRLFLCRDPFGIKPLYFSTAFGGRLAFSSEVRPLLQLEWVNRSLDPAGLVGYLAYGSIQEPHTLVNGVRSLLPGHTLSVDLADDAFEFTESEAYWTPAQSHMDLSGSIADAAPMVRAALAESVRTHMRSDVPVGLFLSGGLDSGSLASLMAESDSRVHTLTVSFGENEFDESVVARAVAARYGTEHHEVRLTAERFLSDMPAWLESQDQPSADGANTWVISRACQQTGLTVALSGLGGDEIFGGYPTFRRAAQFRTLFDATRWMPQAPLKGIVAGLRSMGWASSAVDKVAACLATDGSTVSTYLVLRRFFLGKTLHDLLQPCATDLVLPSGLHAASFERLKRDGNNPDVGAGVRALEMESYMVNTLLRDSDQMSMAHGVELRVPFLDRGITDLAFSLPSSAGNNPRTPKALLRAAMSDRLDDAWMGRPKMGFVFPFDQWLRGALKDEISAGLRSLDAFPFRPGAVQRVWDRFQRGDPRVKSAHILSLHALTSWLGRHGIEMVA